MLDLLTPMALLANAPVAVAPRLSERSHFSVLAALVSAALAGSALVGWIVGLPALTTLVPGAPSMKTDTAIAFLLLAVTVLAQATTSDWHKSHWRIVGLATVLVISTLALLDWGLRIDLALHRWLVAAPSAGSGDGARGPAPVTALCMGLLSVSCLCTGGRHRGSAAKWCPLPSLAAFVLGYAASIGLLFGTAWQGTLGDAFTTVSLPTAACIVLLSAALVTHTPWHSGWLSTVESHTVGGKLMRSAAPVVLIVPAAVIWLQDAARAHGWWSASVGLVFAALALTAALTVFIVRSARWINGLEAKLQESHDTLERRVMERTAELALSNEQLHHSREQLAAVVHSAGAVIISLDRSQRIVLFNAEAERAFGVAASAMIGQPLDALLPHRYRAAHAAHVQNFAAAGQSLRAMGRDAELRGLRADGSEFPVAASIARSGSGEDARVTVVLRDLTQAHELAIERTGRAAAEAASQAKSAFLSRVSHELKTPLNAVIGFSQLLRMDSRHPLSEAQARYTALIEKSARHLDTLVGDLLSLGAAEAGRMVVKFDEIDVHEIIDEAVSMLRPAATATGLSLEGLPAGSLPVALRADRKRVLQIVVNLLSNAIKYNRPYGRVEVGVNRSTDEVVIEVQDTGPGLTPEQLTALFEPFNRLGQDGGPVEGSGLGLVVSRALAQLMNGRIEVDSEVGVGSRFRLILPTR